MLGIIAFVTFLTGILWIITGTIFAVFKRVVLHLYYVDSTSVWMTGCTRFFRAMRTVGAVLFVLSIVLFVLSGATSAEKIHLTDQFMASLMAFKGGAK
jgi:hypothetical protein